ARGRQLRAPHGRGGARGERRVRRFLPESWMRSRRRAPLRRAGRRSRRGRSGDAWRGDIGRPLAGARPGGISARTRRADAEPRRDVTVRPRLPGGAVSDARPPPNLSASYSFRRAHALTGIGVAVVLIALSGILIPAAQREPNGS